VASIQIVDKSPQSIDRRRLVIEEVHRPKVNKIFNEMANDAAALYGLTGTIDIKQFVENYRADFTKQIRDIYRDTIDEFGFSIRSTIKKHWNINFDVKYQRKSLKKRLVQKQVVQIDDPEFDDKIDVVNEQFELESALFVANQSESQANIVTQTNGGVLAGAIAAGLAAFSSEQQNLEVEIDETLNRMANSTGRTRNAATRKVTRLKQTLARLLKNKNKFVGNEIKTKIKSNGKNRSKIITEYNVGLGESKSRHDEGRLINEASLITEQKKILKTVKQWSSILDKRTRIAHVDANGQIVDFREKFLVGGEELIYPRDPAGSAENVINCRCTFMMFVMEV
jgi:hypothetical protein